MVRTEIFFVMKPRPHPSTGPQSIAADIGTQMGVLKQEFSAVIAPFQEAWSEIRKELNSGGKITALVKKSGLDKTWSTLKKATTTAFKPLLSTAKPARRRAKRSVKAVTKVVKKARKKIACRKRH